MEFRRRRLPGIFGIILKRLIGSWITANSSSASLFQGVFPRKRRARYPWMRSGNHRGSHRGEFPEEKQTWIRITQPEENSSAGAVTFPLLGISWKRAPGSSFFHGFSCFKELFHLSPGLEMTQMEAMENFGFQQTNSLEKLLHSFGHRCGSKLGRIQQDFWLCLSFPLSKGWIWN